MGKASSAKKVARAARAGETSATSERRQLGYPALVVAVIILGLVVVAFARQTRDAEVQPTLADHWHASYGVYNCQTDSFLPPFQSDFDPDGIHSHQDGVIHIHPFTSAVTGSEAKLGVFFEAMFTTVTEESISTTGGQTLTAGVECGGEPAIIQIVRWEDAFNPEDPEIFTSDFDDVRLTQDGNGFTIALAPAGFDLPQRQESVDQLAAVIGTTREDALSQERNDVPVVPEGPADLAPDTPVVGGEATDDGSDTEESDEGSDG